MVKNEGQREGEKKKSEHGAKKCRDLHLYRRKNYHLNEMTRVIDKWGWE